MKLLICQMIVLVEDRIEELSKLCKKYDLKKMYLFGSATNINSQDINDLDFLIDFDDSIGYEKYTDNYFALYDDLCCLFNMKIDLVTERSLSNPFFITSVISTKELLFER